jgi:hypothetical protein
MEKERGKEFIVAFIKWANRRYHSWLFRPEQEMKKLMVSRYASMVSNVVSGR